MEKTWEATITTKRNGKVEKTTIVSWEGILDLRDSVSRRLAYELECGATEVSATMPKRETK